tara:strand:- start:418 stop:531 length:114 start_codon:yes stop_codon:yes gene_type:complete
MDKDRVGHIALNAVSCPSLFEKVIKEKAPKGAFAMKI